jgi:hypothetical protein
MCESIDVAAADSEEEQLAIIAGNEIGRCEDDIGIILQDKLLRSARFWRIHVPSPSDKNVWARFPYRDKRPMLTSSAHHGIKEQIWQRWLIVFGPYLWNI